MRHFFVCLNETEVSTDSYYQLAIITFPLSWHNPSVLSPCAVEPLSQASPYPLILSLENHCSVEQQTVMARHLRSILGDKLLSKPLQDFDPRTLPSPEVRRLLRVSLCIDIDYVCQLWNHSHRPAVSQFSDRTLTN